MKTHRIHIPIATLCCAGLLALTVRAQDPADMSPEEQAMMAAFQASMTPGEPHAFLGRQVGHYTAVVKNFEDPSGEPSLSESTVTRALELGGRVLREEWTGSVMGMDFVGVGRTGYDNVTKRYWTTWTDNLSTGLFIAYGDWNEGRDALVFEGEMPDPLTGEMVGTKSVSTYEDGGAERMTMFRMIDGEPVKIMEFEITPR